MELFIRDVPDDVALKLSEHARKQNISREEYIRRILFSTSLNAAENNIFHLRNEVMEKLTLQIKKTNEILDVFAKYEREGE